MDPEPQQTFPRLLKLLYWRVRRNPRVLPHVIAVLFGFGSNSLALWLRGPVRSGRKPDMAIALVEHMGDIMAAEPIARAARRRFPGHRIVWVAKPAYAELAAIFPSVDRVVRVRCLTEAMLLHSAGAFDETWDLHLRGRICERCCIPIAKPGVGPDMDTYYRFGNLATIQCLSAGIPAVPGTPVLNPPRSAVAKVDSLRLPPRFVAIHCVSSDCIRDWPAASWKRLVMIMTRDLAVDVVELGLRPLVIERDDGLARNLCGQLSILETADVIRRATLFIGIDSGLAHLANAVGTRGIVLLGTYLGLDDYMPFSGGYQYGETAELLRTIGAVANLPVETVVAAVMRGLQAGSGANETGVASPE